MTRKVKELNNSDKGTLQRMMFVIVAIAYGIIAMLILFSMSSCRRDTSDLSKYADLDVNDRQSVEVYDDFERLVYDLDEGTSYVYFGKPECPWCQQYFPYFAKAATEHNVKLKLYNAEYVKGTYETVNDDGTISLHVNDEYMKVVNWIYQFDRQLEKGYVSVYSKLTDSQGNYHSSLWLTVPKLFKVVDGEIVDAFLGLDGHSKVQDENGKLYLPPMTNEQKQTLIEKVNKLFEN